MLGASALADITPGSLVDLAITPAPTSIIGATGGARLGVAFATGDFDGNQELDLAISAWSTTAVDTLPPYVVVFFDCGSLTGSIDLASYPGPKATIKAAPGDAGTRVTVAAGDFNSDGLDDLAFGVPNTIQGNYDGKVYMVFGNASLVGTTIYLQNPSVPVTRLLPTLGSQGLLGSTLASGDVNNDGGDELLVAAPFRSPSGRVYLIPGQHNYPATLSVDTAPNVSRISETMANQACGRGLACADVDMDGFADILIGSPGDGLINSSGIASLLMGGPVLPPTMVLSPATPGVTRFYDEYLNGALGRRVALADVDGDGLRDIVMAAPVADPLGCEDCGEVYVVYWGPSLPSNVQLNTNAIPITRYVGAGHVLLYGETLAAGRINADLCADLIMKREPDAFVPLDRRSVVIVYGSHARPDSVFLNTDPSIARVLAEQPGDYLGFGLTITDLDGNSLGDVLIGAPFTATPGRFDAGKVHIFEGSDWVTRSAHLNPSIGINVYPNPFSNSTAIALTGPSGKHASLSIYDVTGQRVFHISDISFRNVSGEISWDGRDLVGRNLPSGVYFCKVAVDNHQYTTKLLLVR